MNADQQRIAIAEACPSVFAVRRFSDGKTQIVWRMDNDTQGPVATVDPLSDLNAMHEAEKTLTHEQRITYWNLLWQSLMVGEVLEHGFRILSATAAQRAEAFLKTLNLWQDDAPKPIGMMTYP